MHVSQSLQTEAALDEGHGLHEHIIAREQRAALLTQFVPGVLCGGMMRIRGTEQRTQGRSI
jgi:hypothetical protein